MADLPSIAEDRSVELGLIQHEDWYEDAPRSNFRFKKRKPPAENSSFKTILTFVNIIIVLFLLISLFIIFTKPSNSSAKTKTPNILSSEYSLLEAERDHLKQNVEILKAEKTAKQNQNDILQKRMDQLQAKLLATSETHSVDDLQAKLLEASGSHSENNNLSGFAPYPLLQSHANISDDNWRDYSTGVYKQVAESDQAFEELYNSRVYPETLMRKARSIVGNTERLKLFLRKLQEGQCIHAIVFGASVSRGTNVGGLKGAWHTKLKSWMNKNYPCNEEEGHTFVMTGLGGGSTKTVVDNYERVLTLRDKIDIFFVEFGANDPFAGDKVTEWMDKKERRLDSDYESLQWLTEIVIRKMLKMRRPDPAAIMYVEMSWWYKKSPYFDSTFRFDSLGGMGAWGHYPILSYYDIPTTSLAEVAMQLSFARDQAFAEHDNPFRGYRTDKCCHPSRYVHILTAWIIAYNFELEMLWADYYIGPYQEDFSMENPPRNRMPFRLTELDIENWVDSDFIIIDFTKESSMKYVMKNNDWEFRSETRKNKTGLIADTAKAHMSVEFDATLDFTRLIVGFLSTYENISPVHIWFDHDGNELCSNCEYFGCTCQGFSDYWGTGKFPGVGKKWGCARDQPNYVKRFWKKNECETIPAEESRRHLRREGCHLTDKGQEGERAWPIMAESFGFNIIDPLRYDNVSIYNSALVQIEGKGKHSIYFCLPKHEPYQKFKLLSLGWSTVKESHSVSEKASVSQELESLETRSLIDNPASLQSTSKLIQTTSLSSTDELPKVAIFATSTDNEYLQYSISSLSLARRMNAKFGWSYFIVGNFSVESEKIIENHGMKPITIEHDDYQSRNDIYHNNWPTQCFWWTYAPSILLDKGFDFSLYIDADVIIMREFDMSELYDVFKDESIEIAGVSVRWPELTKFNSGALWLHNKRLVDSHFSDRFISAYTDAPKKIRSGDQQVLNWMINKPVDDPHHLNIGSLSPPWNYNCHWGKKGPVLEYVSEPDSHPLYMFHAVKFVSTVLPHEKPNSTRHSCEHKPWETLHRSHRFYSDFHRESFEVWKRFHELEWEADSSFQTTP